MNLVSKLKRKKLKSRKCLNELRKRLFDEQNKEILNGSNSASNVNDSEEYFKPKTNYMIMSRLTLGFFNKAVKSETITRYSMQEKSDNNITIFNRSKPISQQSSITSDKSKNSLTKIITSGHDDFFYKAPPKSPSLFSSLKSDRSKDSSIEGSMSDPGEDLHISSMRTLKDDMKHYEYSSFEELSSGIIVEENPITYIKLGYTRGTAESRENMMFSSMRSCSSPAFSVCADDTPDYVYYPHRLNQ